MEAMKFPIALVAAIVSLAGVCSGEEVKYRGIFVNDEDWSLRPWAVKHFGKKEQIGVRAYEEIFSLMEKDGLNLIWPAMHEGGYEFSSRQENLELARKHGITVGTSHCEPMMRNNCYLSKEDKKKWSWTNNRDFLVDYWKEGVRRGSSFAKATEDESEDKRGWGVLWTIGMRGIHDGKMQDGKTTTEKIKILEEVFAAQCAMLPEGAPKLFVPYKEVLPIFNAGLKVPKGTTIMWTNDNFGSVRRVGGPQCEGYGGGIYWHASYHGSPHGYIHLCTTPPAFMWYELVAKCWENGVRDVWMVNAGDVFQAEILLDAYGRFAADPEAWKTKANPQGDALKEWVNDAFCLAQRRGDAERAEKSGNKLGGLCVSASLREKIVSHLAEYYNLGFNRRPEHMCIQWTTNLPATVKSSLLKRYHALLKEDMVIEDSLTNLCDSASLRERYFRLVGFQARFLAYAGIIHLEGRDKEYARSVIDPLYERWDKLDNGKWSGFWCDTIDERGGKRQPTAHNRWSSQMQWPWNEPADPYATKDRGVARVDYPATAYRADVAEPEWLEPVANTPANGGAWTRVEGLGTSGHALALLPVKPGVGKGAAMEFSLTGLTGLTGFEKRDGNHVNLVNPVQKLVLQFLPDFALWPGLKLGVEVSFDAGEARFVAVPKSDANIGEHDPVRNRAVQDNFIRVEVPVPAGAKTVRIVATDPGVVIDRVGIRATVSLALPESAVEFRDCPKCDKEIRVAPGAKKAFVNLSRLNGATRESRVARAQRILEMARIPPASDPKIRPLMGWSSWNTFACEISEDVILETARAMATNGLKDAGYVYVNIDDGFFDGHGEDGILRFHPRRFPRGMKPVVDGIHALGMKAGIYSDAGADTCGSMYRDANGKYDKGGVGGGLYGHDAADCKLHFVDLGFDFIKVDYCGGKTLKLDEKARYTEIAAAIKATGRTDVRLNICRWAFPGTWAADIAESWRTTGDIRANWGSLKKIVKENLYLSAYASPGHFNDMDMLEVGHLKGSVKTAFGKDDGGLTPDEEAMHFGVWCMLSSPLLIGCDARSMPQHEMELVTNPYLLAMNQNDLGLQAYVAQRVGPDGYVLVKDAERRFGTARYVALVNLSNSELEFNVDAKTLDLDGAIEVFDLLDMSDPGGFEGGFSLKVRPHAARFFRFDAERRLERTLYEAETAYLAAYQELHEPEKLVTAFPVEVQGASGGVVVRLVGKGEGNDLVWKDVMTMRGGRRTLAFGYSSQTAGHFFVQIDNGERHRVDVDSTGGAFPEARLEVDLSTGLHSIRISSPDAIVPDIDVMRIR